MLIDTHSHLNFKAFDKDRDEVVKRSLKNNVWLINASSTFNTSKLACEIAEKYGRGVYASVGLHPIHVKEEEFEPGRFKELAKSKKVVAIGETGLDYMYPEQEKQKKVFLEHLALAKELNLPVIFHCRKAHDDMLKILGQTLSLSDEVRPRHLSGVVHCFSGNLGQAEKYLAMGLYLGFNGIIFKFNVDEVIKKIPLNRILIETDCPFLTPPQAGDVRNEPINVKYVAQRIVELRNESFEAISQATTENAKKLFDI